MESFILLFNCLLFLSAIILAVDENSGNIWKDNSKNGGHLTNNILPLHYVVDLDLSHNHIFSNGKCIISILVNHPTRNISFHADRNFILELNFHSINSTNGTREIIHVPTHNSYNITTNIYTFFFDEELSGFYDVYLTFINRKNDGSGFFRTSFTDKDGDKKWIVAIGLEPMGTRRLFPCWDEPMFQANFNITIRHPKGYVILSNIAKIWQKLNLTNDIVSTRFERTPLIPTYHVSAIILSHHTFITSDTVNLQYRSQLDFNYIEFTFMVLRQITKYFNQRGTYLQNLEQFHVAIPHFQYDAVSNLGLIFYRETAITFNKEIDPFMHQIDIVRLVGRAVAYQYLNNRFGPSSWSDMWLNQGISTLLALDAIDQAFPDYRIKNLFVVQIQQESLRLDTDSAMKPIISEINSPTDSVFSFAYYIKAPVILRMLQHMLSDDVFQSGIDKYLSYDSLSKKTNIEVFGIAISAAYNEAPKIDRDYVPNIKETMEIWLKQQHYPILNVTQNDTLTLITTEDIYTSNKKWLVPYMATISRNPDFSLSTNPIRYILTGVDKITYRNTSKKMIFVNLQQIGYYRVNYDDHNLEKITNYLNSDKYNSVHVLNRAQIIDDAFYFLIRGQFPLSVFEKLTTYLSLERDYIAWYPMFKAFEYMSSFFPFEESSNMKDKMIRILDKFHDKMGYQERSNDTYLNSNLKQETARWACAFGSVQCKTYANSKLKEYLLKKYSPLPWWKEWTFCNGLINADINTWNDAFDLLYKEKLHYHTSFINTLSKSLVCSKYFYMFLKYSELIRSTRYDEIIKDNDRINIFHSIVARHAKNDVILDYILENFDKIKPREISMAVALIDIINHVYARSSLDRINQFIETHVVDMLTYIAAYLEHPFIDNSMVINKCTNSNIFILDETIRRRIVRILYLKLKIKLRSSQIKRHIHHFRNFY